MMALETFFERMRALLVLTVLITLGMVLLVRVDSHMTHIWHH